MRAVSVQKDAQLLKLEIALKKNLKKRKIFNKKRKKKDVSTF
jgi:hypothetical protein